MSSCRLQRVSSLIAGALLFVHVAAFAQGKALAAVAARSSQSATVYQADAVLEAVRQTQIAAQVAGAIVALPVKAGDTVKSGQTLARIDARAAMQDAAASRAQVDAARAVLLVASKDYERQKQLFAKNYISQAQLDRAAAQYQSAAAQANAQLAQAGSAQIQSGLYTISAPYAGVISDMPLTAGDMALPGRTLMTMYDPAVLRATANVPQSQIARLNPEQKVTIEIPSLPAGQNTYAVSKVTVLPSADAATHTVTVRFDLPPDIKQLMPGMFARVYLPLTAGAGLPNGDGSLARVYVPQQAIVRRAELFAVYVLEQDGKAHLRQIKAGAASGREREVLSGLSAGELVALDPVQAARQSGRL